MTEIDGPLFRNLVIAAFQGILLEQGRLNALNTFPVPDRDTGTNLALTLRAAADGARVSSDPHLGVVALSVSSAAVRAAHGCSGAIVAEYLRGFANHVAAAHAVGAQMLADAAAAAARSAVHAVDQPEDGRILSAMQRWADGLAQATQTTSDVVTACQMAADIMRASVASDSRSGAADVDAGALGFVVMVDAMATFLRTGAVPVVAASTTMPVSDLARATPMPMPEYQFCTRALVVGSHIDRPSIRRSLGDFGDSLIVGGDRETLSVHIHTNTPDAVLQALETFGAIAERRIEDMRAQYAIARERAATPSVRLVTDSACDLPADIEIRGQVRTVPLQITFGQETYLDKITLSNREFYRLLATSPHLPTTSQPTSEDFRATYATVADLSTAVVVVTVSSALSGTYRAAVTATKGVDGRSIVVVDSRSVSVGIGLIVREGIAAAERGGGMATVVERLEWAVQHVRVYATVRTLDHLLRGGRLTGVKGQLARFLHIKPVLTLDNSGRVAVAATAFTAEGARRHLRAIMRRDPPTGRCLIAHADAVQTAQRYADDISERFGVSEIECVPMSAAFGSHAGPGAIAVAWMGARDRS